jgi:four helix bundle protein
MIICYKDLNVWQKSIELVEGIYGITKNFPKSEEYGLKSQMKRCAISIPSNIAEGNRRGTKKEYIRFVSIAFGSGAELETQLIIAEKLGFLKNSDSSNINNLLEQVMKMLNGLIISLK